MLQWTEKMNIIIDPTTLSDPSLIVASIKAVQTSGVGS